MLRNVSLLLLAFSMFVGCSEKDKKPPSVENRLAEVEKDLKRVKEDLTQESQISSRRHQVQLETNKKLQEANRKTLSVLTLHGSKLKKAQTDLSDPKSELSIKIRENAQRIAIEEINKQLPSPMEHGSTQLRAPAVPEQEAVRCIEDYAEQFRQLREEIRSKKNYDAEIQQVREELRVRLENVVVRYRAQQPQFQNGVMFEVYQDMAPSSGEPAWYRWVTPRGREPILEVWCVVSRCACGNCQVHCDWLPARNRPQGLPGPNAK